MTQEKKTYPKIVMTAKASPDGRRKEAEQQVQQEQHAKRKYTRKAALVVPCQNITIEDVVKLDESGFLFAEICHRIGR